MFVHYSKTKAEFISAGLATTYNDSIVFIKGDANGNGSCIYTHGQYFANFSEFLAAINYVKGITVGGQSYNAAAGGGYVAFEASDPSTVAVNTSQSGVSIGLTEAFVNKVNNTATNLGSKGDAASADGSAFARIANLAARLGELTGDEDGGQSIAAQINALRTEIVGTLGTDDAKTLAAINDELDTLVAYSDDLFEGLEELRVNEKPLYDRSGGATPITLAGIDIKVGGSSSVKDSTVEAAIASHQSAIDTLNGTGAGSVSKQVADAIAGVVDSAPEDFDTLKEIADYIASDKTNATQINNDLSAIKNYSVNGKKFSVATDGAVTLSAEDIEFNNPDGATDYPFIGATDVHYALLGLSNYTKALNNNKQDKIDDLATIRSGAASGATAYQKPSTGIPATDLASAVQTSLGKADAAAPQATTYTKAEVDAMWEWEEL